MTSVQRFLGGLVGFVLLFAAWAPSISLHAAAPSLTPYVSQLPPQRADGDFDGDGRIDTALIENRAGAARISIRLTSSSTAFDLDPVVTGVVQGDIDHDGDLDLVAATSSGELLVWINDGHGHFTRQAASRTSALSGEPVLVAAAADQPIAIDVRAAPLPPSRQSTTLVSRASGGPRMPCRAIAPCGVVLPLLRAPPAQSL
jgi:hypothetical protein